MNEIKPQRNVVPLSEAEKELQEAYLRQKREYEEMVNDRIKAEAEQRERSRKRIRNPINPKKPFVSKTTKIGRNQPCPCGSGKKYKKCCGKEEL